MTVPGMHLHLTSCGSTNDEAARMARAGAGHGFIVTAEEQTAGRGRQGRTWQSTPGNVFLSMVLRVPVMLTDVAPLTLALGVGACEALRALGVPAHVKWPNDIVLVEEGRVKKLAGILLESQSSGGRLDAIVAGIGVNLLPTDPADPLAKRRASLADLGLTISTTSVIEALRAEWLRWVDHFIGGGVAAVTQAWEECMWPVTHLIDGQLMVAQGLELDGALRLAGENGTAIHRFGDAPAADWQMST